MDTEVIDRSFSEVDPPEIDNFAIIIGAMKSGTTSLFEYLSQHPQICRSKRKEINFFSRRGQWEQGPAHYRSFWSAFDPVTHRRALEASPQYTQMLKFVGVPERIRALGANFRFIYIVRNPVDRIESHLAHNIAARRLGFDFDFRHRLVRHAIRTSRYAYQLDRFRAGLDDPAILILDFGALCRAPLEVAERCIDFLGLDPFPFSEIPPANVRKSRNRADEFRLDPERRAAFARRLRPDILRFRDRYGFDVSGWNLL